MENLDKLTVPQLKALMGKRGIPVPSSGTGKNKAVVKMDLIAALSSSPRTTPDKVVNIMDLYDPVKTLGEGAYGSVYLATSKETGEKVAIKEILIKNKDVAEREFAITKNIGCLERVLCYRKMIQGRDNIYLIMDYLPGKDLFDVVVERSGGEYDDLPVVPFSVSEMMIMFEQLLVGLNALHSNNIVHMDLKSENIRSTTGGLVIIDLGMTCSLVNTPACDINYSPGTKETWSPEMGYAFTQLRPKMIKQEFFASDVWMMGLVFKDIENLNAPCMTYIFAQPSRELYLRKWAEVNSIPRASTSCEPLNKLIDSMLEIDYTKRASTSELLTRIRSIKC